MLASSDAANKRRLKTAPSMRTNIGNREDHNRLKRDFARVERQVQSRQRTAESTVRIVNPMAGTSSEVDLPVLPMPLLINKMGAEERRQLAHQWVDSMTVRALPGRLHALIAFPVVNLLPMAVLCARAGRLTAKPGCFCPGQEEELFAACEEHGQTLPGGRRRCCHSASARSALYR
jgi:hypothetical protein